MRILVLAPQPFFALRGTPIAVRMLLNSLAAEGHEVDAITFAEGEPIEIEGVTFHRVPDLPFLRGIRPGFSLKKVFADILMAFMAIRMLWRGGYDVVHAVEEMAYFARFAKPFFRIPYVFDLDSSIPQQIAEKYALPNSLNRMLEVVERGTLRSATAAMTCCPALEQMARDGAPDVPVVTLTDVSFLDGSVIEQEEVDTSDAVFDAPTVMYIGNFEHYQGIDLLMEGFAKARAKTPMHLVIIGGNDADIARYQGKADSMSIGAATHFLGPRPLSSLGAYLKTADVLVSPRLKGVNTPMKVYSYLDSGRPVLATALSTHTQVICNEIAMLVEPTAEAMAYGLLRLIENPDAASAMAARAKARVAAEFSTAGFHRKLTHFYEHVVTPRLATKGGLGRGSELTLLVGALL